MNKVEIYYFSGTGNSLHVTKELQKLLPGAIIIPVLSLLDKEQIKTNGEVVGFVFPTYFGTIPFPVRMFIKKLNLESAKYIFAIATYANYKGLVNIRMDRLLKEKGKKLDHFFHVAMTMNTPTGIMPKILPGYQKIVSDWVNKITKENVTKLELELPENIGRISKTIMNKEKDTNKKVFNFYLKCVASKIMDFMENQSANIPYYSDETCAGCGTCEKVCLSEKIKLVDKKPLWQKDTRCYYCYACFNFCPTQSILIKDKYNLKTGRYHHPQIFSKDIGEQKNN